MVPRHRKTGVAGWVVAAVLVIVVATPVLRAQDSDPESGDPPSRVARVSVLDGNVSLQPASVQQFNQAEINYPMTTGDRIYADMGAVAEIQTGQIAVRLGQQTDLTVTAMTDTLAQFGLAEGAVHLRTYNIYQGEAVEMDTPSAAVSVLQAGDVRVDVDPSSGSTTVGVYSGQVQVDGNGVQQVLEPGEWLQVNQGGALAVGPAQPDGLDRFSAERDSVYQNAMASEAQYVNPGVIGAEDLSGYGSWGQDDEGEPVWFPAGVAVGWQPYLDGQWTWVAPWGWTWVEAEPWGFAPFHYGRWGQFAGRWGWMPGPPIARPVYSPALVAFVGGGSFQAGVTAWFPLGPHEVYQPWYHASGLYLNRVNVSNIYTRNVSQVRNIYNQRTVVNSYAAANNSYANRQTATVAVAHSAFAGGQRVDHAAVRVSAQQVASAQVLPHPLVTPERGLVAGAPAKAVPAVTARPVLQSQEDRAVRPSGAMEHPQTTETSVRNPSQPQRAQTPAPPAPQPENGGRTLVNRAVPPPARPSFDQQREAIQQNDPGRPLGPQQLNNLRNNQPAGPPQQREQPHPQAAPEPHNNMQKPLGPTKH